MTPADLQKDILQKLKKFKFKPEKNVKTDDVFLSGIIKDGKVDVYIFLRVIFPGSKLASLSQKLPEVNISVEPEYDAEFAEEYNEDFKDIRTIETTITKMINYSVKNYRKQKLNESKSLESIIKSIL